MEILGYGVVLAIGVLIALASRLVLLLLLAFVVFADSVFQATFESKAAVVRCWAPARVDGVLPRAVPARHGVLRLPRPDPVPAWGGAGPVRALGAAVPHSRYVLPLTAAYGTVTLATHWPQRLERAGQWVYGSYGISIWGFLLQQLIIMACDRDPWLLVVLSLPVAYLAGQVSWRFVEQPTLRLRKYLRAPAVRPKPLLSEPAEPAAVPILSGQDVA
jgi:peptidoglycan/LPS O-acetylase OafA/YrhL